MMNQFRPTLLTMGIIAACAVLYLAGNASVPLWDRDEPRYAMASRWMLNSGDWIVPRIGWGAEPQTPRTAKPVMIYWLQAGAMAIFGVDSFAARFPSAVAMTLTLAVFGAVIGRWAGWRRAMWSVLVLGSSAMAIVAAKMSVTDAVLLLFIVIAQLCLLSLYLHEQKWPVAFLMWIAIALAGLTKGPVVIGVQLMTMGVLLLFDLKGRWKDGGAWIFAMSWWRRIRPLYGLVIVAAVCGPWLWLVHDRAPDFLPTIIGHDVIRRSTQALEGHRGPPGFYLLTIFATFFPWSLLLPLSLSIAWRHRAAPQTRFALAAVIGPWIMMELVATKLVHYVLPIFPPLAFLVADAIVRCVRGEFDDLRNRTAVLGTAVWSTAVLALGAAPWAGWYWFAEFPYWQTAAVSLTAAAWAIAVFLLVRRHRTAEAMAMMGGGMLVVMAIVFAIYLPSAGWFHLAPRAAAVLVEHGATRPGESMMLGYKEQSLAFYQGGTIQEQKDEDFLLRTPVNGWPRWIVLPWDQWKRLSQAQQSKLERIAEFDGINVAKGDYVHLMVVRRHDP